MVDTDAFTALDLLHALVKKETKLDGNWTVTMNTLRYINTNHTHYYFGLESCNALPVFHAFQKL